LFPLYNYIYVNENGSKQSFDLDVQLQQREPKFQTKALLDSGAYSCFIHQRFVAANKLKVTPLGRTIRVFNADGTKNTDGLITSYTQLVVTINDHQHTQNFLVTNIGRQNMIIGHSFLRFHNPDIDWKNDKIYFTCCPKSCLIQPSTRIDEEEIDGLELPHLEDVARDQYTQLNNDSWESDAHFIHWIENSDNPVARYLAAHTVLEEDMGKSPVSGKDNRDYWSPYVPQHYHQHGVVFSKTASERMPTQKPYDHAIKLNPGTILPKPAKLYPLNPQERHSLDEWIASKAAKGYICPSKSLTAAPVFFVKKKDGSLHLVQDYRALNAVTKKNKFPILCISNLIDWLSSNSIFTSMDLHWGFNNVQIQEGDEEKAAFITSKGLFEPTVMYFGFCNAPSTFQHMMNEVLKDKIATGHVVVYIDDILIFTDNLTLHRQLVNRVLEKLKANDLFIKLEKCQFEQSEVEFLGLIVSKNSIKMNPAKVAGVKDWPTPTKVKHVQAFLGLANFYCRFIKDFAKITRLLSLLTCKNETWNWMEDCQHTFDALKTAFTTAPILQIPNDTAPY
jgi:hypothetical protein